MTPKEAIKDINGRIKTFVGGKSLDMAIYALEKQIPKKPKAVYGNGKGIPDYYCPVCDGVVAGFIERNFVKEHHCRCGQAIDWSDEE